MSRRGKPRDPTAAPGHGEAVAKGYYVPINYGMIDSPAFKQLRPGAFKLFLEVCRLHHPAYENNGKLRMSVREAAVLLRCRDRTAADYFMELERKGFLVCTFVGQYSGRASSTWAATIFPHCGNRPTFAFNRWQPGLDFPIAPRPKRMPRGGHFRKQKLPPVVGNSESELPPVGDNTNLGCRPSSATTVENAPKLPPKSRTSFTMGVRGRRGLR